MELKQKVDTKEKQLEHDQVRLREEYEQKYKEYEALVIP